MKKQLQNWTIKELKNRFANIDFPDYQRESTVWSKGAKQLLIDSILREFDIASLYFYEDEFEGLSCIDGRQRINAIMSFLNENREDQSDNGFALRISNEIYPEKEEDELQKLDGYTYTRLLEDGNKDLEIATSALKRIHEYKLSVVILSKIAEPGEFNLQFTRLNLGAIINAGERLNAMIGEMRDLCFDNNKVGQHPFLEFVRIPTRRFAKEQIVAQSLIQMFSLVHDGTFTKARHFDLQRFFKENLTLSTDDRTLASELSRTYDTFQQEFPDAGLFFHNRAITVSATLVAWKQKMYDDDNIAKRYIAFIREFITRLKWQLKLRSAEEPVFHAEYRYLIDFQRYVTQAAVEKSAVEARHNTLTEEFEKWLDCGRISGDEVFQDRTSTDPSVVSKSQI